jgi:hypothetical protein
MKVMVVTVLTVVARRTLREVGNGLCAGGDGSESVGDGDSEGDKKKRGVTFRSPSHHPS